MVLIHHRKFVLLTITSLVPLLEVVWAFSSALIRPVAAGFSRSAALCSDNASWGFIERAANWGLPLAILVLQKERGYEPKDLTFGLGAQLSFLDDFL